MAAEDHEHEHSRCERAAVALSVAEHLEGQAEGLEGLPKLRAELRAIAAAKRAEAARLADVPDRSGYYYAPGMRPLDARPQ